MKKTLTAAAISSFILLFLCLTLIDAQRRQRPPWEERSPKLGKAIPEVQIYDELLNQIPISNLYKDAELLVIQWGGCT